jgi:hypothetical protein
MARGTATWVIASGSVLSLCLSIAACEEDPTLPALAFDAGSIGFDSGPPNLPPPVVAGPAIDGGPDAPIDPGVPAACDDGKIDPGETCDPLGSCPTACPASACQIRTLENGGTCKARCVDTTLQTACINGDGCCPAGGSCNATNDTDCTAVCNNGVVESGESCDPASAVPCPTDCPKIACQLRTLQNGGTCTAACVNGATITECVNGDGCCPTGGACNANNDSDCAQSCGNNVVEANEKCDPLSTCPTVCPPPAGDRCQLRKLVAGGTCQAECVDDTRQTACINGDGCCPSGCNANNDNDCAPACDNGAVEPGEFCDPLTSCPSTCRQVACQLFKVENPRTCQARCVADTIQTACTGTTSDGCCPSTCNANRSHANFDVDCGAVCGNGILEPGETCDPQINCGRGCATPRYTCFENLGSAATCNLDCNVPVLKCEQRNDNCCPFNSSDGCTAGNDPDCAGPKWELMEWPDKIDILRARCTDVAIRNVIPGASYEFTTCTPAGSANPLGLGDWDIVDVTDNLKNTYAVSNLACSDPNALPRLSGSNCKERNTGAEVQACASPSPGGFRALPGVSSLSVRLCLSANDATKGAETPLYIWYNAPSAPRRD